MTGWIQQYILKNPKIFFFHFKPVLIFRKANSIIPLTKITEILKKENPLNNFHILFQINCPCTNHRGPLRFIIVDVLMLEEVTYHIKKTYWIFPFWDYLC